MGKRGIDQYTISSILKAVKKFLNYKTIVSVKMSSSEEFEENVVCQVSDLQENEIKTFKLADGEVLLVKQKGVINALGTKCTHYGAPLEKGALGNGRIRCPWHGACFNLSTGDIEDFPGIDSLPCYQVSLCGENVKVKANKRDLTANKRIKNMVAQDQSSKDSVVVIGGGPAAAVCVETLRQENFAGSITMICKENVLPYDRVKCTKQMDFNITQAQFRNDSFYKEHDITIMKGVEATGVNTGNKTVTLSNQKTIPYTKLFIATGNVPFKPSIPGIDLKNVFVLRNNDDAKAIQTSLSKNKNLVIIGSGFIGMEVTDYCLDKVKKITVLMRGKKPLMEVLGEDIADVLLKLFKEKGVDFRPLASVTEIKGTEQVESVQLCDGTNIPADIVVLGTGVTPSTCFLRNSGIKLEENGTIPTTIHLETNIRNIYVGGDIAFAPVFSNDDQRAAIGHFGLAHYHGKIAGLNMAGKATPLKTVPYFWTKLLGYSIRYCGYGEFNDVILTGSVKDMKFLLIYVNSCNAVAMSSCNMDPYVSKFAEITVQGKKLKKADLLQNPLNWGQD